MNLVVRLQWYSDFGYPLRKKCYVNKHTNLGEKMTKLTHAKDGKQPKKLLRFAGMPRQIMPKGLPFQLKSYLELVEFTGRCIREDKRGYIESTHLPLLERVNISPENWLKLTTQFTRVFHGAVGRPASQDGYCENLNDSVKIKTANMQPFSYV